MEEILERVCGLDVHKNSIVACVRTANRKGKPACKEIKTFPTHLRGLKQMGEWLVKCCVQAIGMDGTGIYCRPVYAVLEALASWTLIVGNARHIKNVPDRKTDVKDADWLSDWVAYGLIRPSFVPPPWQRELRDVVRNRSV